MPSVRLAYVMFAILAVGSIADAGRLDDSTAAEGSPRWDASVSLFYYALPAEADFPLVVGAADRGALHGEVRYNYEDLKTVSLFGGWNIAGGESVEFLLTPMAGVAFGQTTGLIPALELSLATGAFDFYVEGEYLVDLDDSEASFFYTWSELGVTLGPVRTGVTAQRTRIFQTPLEIDRGLFAQLMQGPASFSFYAFNIATESTFLVFGLAVEF